MRSLLITGAAGFIGANFAHFWCREFPADKLVILDLLTYAGNRRNLEALADSANYKFVHGDICNDDLVEALMAEHEIDTIVHFAAESHVDRSIDGPDAFITTNILGTHTLLKAAKKAWLDAGTRSNHRFHHVSTDEVYGTLGPNDPAFTEETAYAPNSPYSASKAASDHLVRAYHHTYGLDVTTSNCSNNYGPYQFPEKLIPLFLINILEGRPLPIYGDGQQIRDWLHVEDHCRGIVRVIEDGRCGETYNIGGNCERANLDIVECLCAALDLGFENDGTLKDRFPNAPQSSGGSARDLITYVEDRLGHDRRYAVNASKIRDELGFDPAHTFDTGFASTLAWYLDNEDWWRSVLDNSYRGVGQPD